VSAGTYLQIAGAVCELGGLTTVAWGIADTSERFGTPPGTLRRAWAGVRRTSKRLIRRRRDAVVPVEVTAAVSMVGGGSMSARATVGFGPWDEVPLEETIGRLRHASESEQSESNDIVQLLDGEEKARRASDERHEGRVDEVRRELTEIIQEASAGGLRLQTVGVWFFALGVVLGMWGNLLS
jgi:hypothetical protein